MICPACRGERKLAVMFAKFVDGVSREPVSVLDCPTCDGKGEITDEHFMRRAKGMDIRALRLAKGIGLRKCAERIGVLPSQLSYAEQGRVDPDEMLDLVKQLDT